MKTLEKITKSKLFLILIIILLIKPGIFSENTQLTIIGNIIDILRIGIFIYAILVFFINKLKINKNYLFLIYYLILFIPTFIYDGNYFYLIVQFSLMIVWIILFDYNMKYNKDNFIDALEIALFILLTINFITVVLFPGGMYTNSQGFLANYFLGYDNNFILIIFPAIAVSFLNSYRKHNKLTLKPIILYLICFLTLLFSWTVTSLIAFIIFSIILLYNNLKKDKFTKGVLIFSIVFLIVLFLIIFLQYSQLFEYIIENILKKDTTFSGRTDIWSIYLNLIYKKPIIGYGLEESSLLIQKTGYLHAHNMWINLLYEGGIILTTFFIFLIIIYTPKKRNINPKIRNLYFSILISILIVFLFKAYITLSLFFIILIIFNYHEYFEYKKLV